MERYWISGVQLGILIALEEPCKREHFIYEIVDKQYLNKKKVNVELQNALTRRNGQLRFYQTLVRTLIEELGRDTFRELANIAGAKMKKAK